MGQENYLVGLAFKRMPWATADPDWDHDHCAFCWKKLWDRASNESEAAIGYATEDEYSWICDVCFAAFKERFRGSVVEHPDPFRRA